MDLKHEFHLPFHRRFCLQGVTTNSVGALLSGWAYGWLHIWTIGSCTVRKVIQGSHATKHLIDLGLVIHSEKYLLSPSSTAQYILSLTDGDSCQRDPEVPDVNLLSRGGMWPMDARIAGHGADMGTLQLLWDRSVCHVCSYTLNAPLGENTLATQATLPPVSPA